MPKQSMPVKEAAGIAEKLARELEVELVDTELVKEPTGRFLRFYIDREDGISVNELECFHRAVLPLVERVEYDFLEVSSPGADRPLKTDKDFEKNEGLTVELKTYRSQNGQKVFVGDLVGLREGKIVIRVAESEEMAFERKDVAIVRPVLDFDEDDLKDDSEAN